LIILKDTKNFAIKAYREGKLPFPDGTIIAQLAWRRVMSEENNVTFRRAAERQGLPPEEITKLLAWRTESLRERLHVHKIASLL